MIIGIIHEDTIIDAYAPRNSLQTQKVLLGGFKAGANPDPMQEFNILLSAINRPAIRTVSKARPAPRTIISLTVRERYIQPLQSTHFFQLYTLYSPTPFN